MFDLILFDLDGTLVDTAGDLCDAANDVLLARTLPTITQARARTWIGHGSRELMIRAYAYVTRQPEDAVRCGPAIDSMMVTFSDAHERRCGRRSTVFPQVRETLETLRTLGVPMALLTNREHRFARTVLERHGLQDFFDPVIAGDTLPVRKPDPATVRHCLRQHDVPAQRALLVGDSDIDLATGRNAGVATWIVTYGYDGGRPIALSAPDRLIPDLSPLAEEVRGCTADRIAFHPVFT